MVRAICPFALGLSQLIHSTHEALLLLFVLFKLGFVLLIFLFLLFVCALHVAAVVKGESSGSSEGSPFPYHHDPCDLSLDTQECCRVDHVGGWACQAYIVDRGISLAGLFLVIPVGDCLRCLQYLAYCSHL